MADRRDLRRPRPPVGRPVFHFDTGPRPGRQDHDDITPYTDFVDHVDDHEDHEDHVDDHDDEGAFWTATTTTPRARTGCSIGSNRSSSPWSSG
jgi:hypothetical protein